MSKVNASPTKSRSSVNATSTGSGGSEKNHHLLLKVWKNGAKGE